MKTQKRDLREIGGVSWVAVFYVTRRISGSCESVVNHINGWSSCRVCVFDNENLFNPSSLHNRIPWNLTEISSI